MSLKKLNYFLRVCNVFDGHVQKLKYFSSSNLFHNKSQLTTNFEDNYKKNIIITIIGSSNALISTAILLKQNPIIHEIHLINTDSYFSGYTNDILQIDSSTLIKFFKKESILDGLKNADIVAVMDEKLYPVSQCEPFLQFYECSNYVKKIAEKIAASCPEALVAIFTYPITATVPLVSEIFKCFGLWNPNKIFGCATIEAMHFTAIAASYLNINPSCIAIPVTGGIDSLTTVPLLCKIEPSYNFTPEEKNLLTSQVKIIKNTISKSEVKASVLSHSLGAAKFLSILVNGLEKKNISIADAYVRSDILSCQYLTSKVKFGPNGIEQNFGLPKVTAYEIYLIEQITPIIQKMINVAISYVKTGKTY